MNTPSLEQGSLDRLCDGLQCPARVAGCVPEAWAWRCLGQPDRQAGTARAWEAGLGTSWATGRQGQM